MMIFSSYFLIGITLSMGSSFELTQEFSALSERKFSWKYYARIERSWVQTDAQSDTSLRDNLLTVQFPCYEIQKGINSLRIVFSSGDSFQLNDGKVDLKFRYFYSQEKSPDISWETSISGEKTLLISSKINSQIATLSSDPLPFHTYSIEWDDKSILWYMDNQMNSRQMIPTAAKSNNPPGKQTFQIAFEINFDVNKNVLSESICNIKSLQKNVLEIDYIKLITTSHSRILSEDDHSRPTKTRKKTVTPSSQYASSNIPTLYPSEIFPTGKPTRKRKSSKPTTQPSPALPSESPVTVTSPSTEPTLVPSIASTNIETLFSTTASTSISTESPTMLPSIRSFPDTSTPTGTPSHGISYITSLTPSLSSYPSISFSPTKYEDDDDGDNNSGGSNDDFDDDDGAFGGPGSPSGTPTNVPVKISSSPSISAYPTVKSSGNEHSPIPTSLSTNVPTTSPALTNIPTSPVLSTDVPTASTAAPSLAPAVNVMKLFNKILTIAHIFL